MTYTQLANQAIAEGFAKHYYVAVLIPSITLIVAIACFRPKIRFVDFILFALGTALSSLIVKYSDDSSGSHLICFYVILAIIEKLYQTSCSNGNVKTSNFSNGEVSKICALSFLSILAADIACPLPNYTQLTYLGSVLHNLRFVGGDGLKDGLMLVPSFIAIALVFLRD